MDEVQWVSLAFGGLGAGVAMAWVWGVIMSCGVRDD